VSTLLNPPALVGEAGWTWKVGLVLKIEIDDPSQPVDKHAKSSLLLLETLWHTLLASEGCGGDAGAVGTGGGGWFGRAGTTLPWNITESSSVMYSNILVLRGEYPYLVYWHVWIV